MSNFKLDVESPFENQKQNCSLKSNQWIIQKSPSYRFYVTIKKMIDAAINWDEGEMKDACI